MVSFPPEEKAGLLIWGSDQTRPLHFYVVAGVDLNEHTLPILSATGVPDEDDFPSIDPTGNPLQFREAITDTNVWLDQEDKQFYKDTVQQEFLQSLEENLSQIKELMQSNSPRQPLEEFLRSDLSKFRATEINVALVEYEKILFENDGSQSQSKTDNESGSESEASGIEVTPVIDVNEGTPVDSLSSGDLILVKFTDDAIEQYNLSEEYEDVPLKATFREYRLPRNEVEGTLIVTLEEGVRGVAEVSTGSLVKAPSYINENKDGRFEQKVASMIIIAAVLLTCLAVVSFVVIF